MEVIKHELTKVVSLFWLAEPAGALYSPSVVNLIVERYKFVGYPRSLEEMRAEKVSFLHGEFEGRAIESLEVYSDGIIASSRSDSELVDRFIEDIINWTESSFGHHRIDHQKITKIYENHILFQTKSDIFRVLTPLEAVKSMLSAGLKKSSNIDAEFHSFGLSFGVETSKLASLKPIPFRIERRIGTDFSRNIFVSAAPLPTREHLNVLNKLQELVG